MFLILMKFQTLINYAVDSLFTKDFINICNDTHSFLYHIGPIVLYSIIQEDLQRREFGHCFYVEKNAVIKLFPENMIKKMKFKTGEYVRDFDEDNSNG